MKSIVTGSARHGKDTVSLYMEMRYGFNYESSSVYACGLFIFNRLAPLYGYSTPLECYLDRGQHRSEWFDLIVEYNTPDPARFSRDLFEHYDIYCGLRNRDEMLAAHEANLYDFAIWVDASKRKPKEPATSLTIREEDCDFTVDNNGTLHDLFKNIDVVMATVGCRPVAITSYEAVAKHIPEPFEQSMFIAALGDHLKIAA